MQDEPLLHGDGVRLISAVLPSEFAIDVGVCVVLLGWGFVAFIFCRVLREFEIIVVVARWLCVVTGGDLMQYAAGSEGMVRKSHNFHKNHHIRIHFEIYLTSDLRQFMFFKQYFTKSVGPGRLSAEKLKVI